MQFACSGFICSGGFFGGVEGAAIVDDAVDLNFRLPLFIETVDASITDGVVIAKALIVVLLRFCCCAKIVPSIVKRVAIDVIDSFRWLLSGHKFEDDAMSKVSVFWHGRAGDGAAGAARIGGAEVGPCIFGVPKRPHSFVRKMLAWPFFPVQPSDLRMIVEAFAEIRERWKRSRGIARIAVGHRTGPFGSRSSGGSVLQAPIPLRSLV